ncbi:hypothetical protein ZIOFF_069823 [Zingiber officinale]|uniref:Uncharacterized protein n=1 Tax=Zingiber officinale TaxID=94328 RepID=A0A8J5C4C8_ZINOF|nr:hypothetical protein ZIOFF_069823 [Zingiber officinale]
MSLGALNEFKVFMTGCLQYILGELTYSLPLFRDVPILERQALFLRKLRICSVLFDFSDTLKSAREKEVKRQTLSELVDFVQSGSGRLNEQPWDFMFSPFLCDWELEKNYSERVMLIYDGLYYDALAMSPYDGAPEEFDQTIFSVRSDRSIGPMENFALNLLVFLDPLSSLDLFNRPLSSHEVQIAAGPWEFSWEQLSWSKAFVKKWFNIKSKGQDNHVDEIASKGTMKWRNELIQLSILVSPFPFSLILISLMLPFTFQLFGRPQWLTVKSCSQCYVDMGSGFHTTLQHGQLPQLLQGLDLAASASEPGLQLLKTFSDSIWILNWMMEHHTCRLHCNKHLNLESYCLLLKSNMMSVAASFYKATLAVIIGISVPFNNLAIIYKQRTAADGLVNRGNTFKEIGRVTEAIQDYICAVNIRPTMPQAHANLASAYKDR